eukprot:2722098-Heterocapsa_arctica.AAC.1
MRECMYRYGVTVLLPILDQDPLARQPEIFDGAWSVSLGVAAEQGGDFRPLTAGEDWRDTF